ncbi:MAG: protease inhibitor I42 family protein, partial [Firmicutes bacterium]|nr:protease inhibitor I42 family protein [Bacillota bacterium]
SSDASGTLQLLSAAGMPEQYMSGTVTIRLLENPTTGYGWTVAVEPQGMLSPVRDAYEQDETAGGALGAGGVHTWVFQGETPGTATVTFRYARSSDAAGKAESELMLTYVINADNSVELMGLDGDYSMYVP